MEAYMGFTMKKIFVAALFFFLPHINFSSSPILTLFIEKLESTTSLSKGQEGIPVTYYGEKTISNNDGQVSFPLKDTVTTFYILVTPSQNPIFMLYNTLAGWTVGKNADYALYRCELVHDQELNLWYWNTQQAKLLKDRKVPLQTVVIYAQPTEIIVPTGITLTIKGPHLMLPTLYAQLTINLVDGALAMLENNEFFATLDTNRQIAPTKDPNGSGLVESKIVPPISLGTTK